MKYIKKDYPNEKIITQSYTGFEKILIKNLNKLSVSDLQEKRFQTDMELQSLEINDFDKFVGIRLGYYALVLALFAIILSNQDLLSQMSYGAEDIVYGITFFMLTLIVSHNLTSRSQRERLIYYRFKLNCIDKVMERKLVDNEKISRKRG